MADIRINSLPSTATSFNTDDYIAIDGASAGTRRMLAANPPFSDVTLGTSGPSVKSTLSARAPRQGLVFDGTAGATHSNITLGSGDFTVAVWARVPTTSAANRQLLGSSGGDTALFLDTTGLAKIYISGQTTHTASSVVPDQKSVLIVYTRSGTSGTFYQNAVSNGAVTDSNNYSTAWSYFGARSGGGYTTGTLIPLIYNRALSASEVVALYEAGAPAGADYGPSGYPAGTAVANNGSFGTDGTVSPSVNTGPALTWSDSDGGYAYSQGTAGPSFKGGKKAYVTFTASGVSGTITAGLYRTGEGTPQSIITVANGANVIPVATGGASVGLTISFNWSSASAATLTNISWVAVGLLLAPDAAQAGGGLVWYDTSGNAANITLPASGVSWNVPTSGYVTSGSSLNLSAGGTNQNITLTPSGTGVINSAFGSNLKLRTSLGTTNVGTARIGVWYSGYVSNAEYAAIEMAAAGTSGGDIRFFTIQSGSTLSQKAMLAENGNFLVGTTTDGGQKLQVSGDIISTSTSGSNIIANDPTFNHPVVQLREAGTNKAAFETVSGDAYVSTQTAGKSLYLRSGNSTTALTLDSSQNATFAKNLTVNGTSINTFAGPLIGQGTTITGYQFLAKDTNAVAVGGAYALQTTGGTDKWRWGLRGSAGSLTDSLIFSTLDGSWLDALTLEKTGNATFAGTGKFATSVTISKTDNPYLLLRKTAATAVDWYLQYNTNGVELYGGTTPAAYFRVLDTGNATFAGTATATRLIANSQWVAASAGTGALSATANAGVQLTGTGAVNDVSLVNKNGDNVMVIPTGTTNATFAGAIAIGNTVNTVSPTSPNRTITMVIGGTTYYIHAKTTND